MSMVFAGFMAAAKDERVRKEDLANEQAKEEKSWQRQLDLLDITDRKQQEILDRKTAKDVKAFMSVHGLDPSLQSQAYEIVDSFGLATANEMVLSGALKLEGKAGGATASWNGQVSDNGKVMYDTFVNELGYDATVAAGLVGNFMQESGVEIDTSAVGDGGASIGAGQWNKSRGVQFKNFAAERGLNIADPKTAALFTDYELKTTEKSAAEKIFAAAGDPAAVAKAASEAFWRPGMPMVENRMKYATGVYEAMYDAKVPGLTDTGAAQGGLSFGPDKQMSDLGLGPVEQTPTNVQALTSAPLTLPTVSTQGVDAPTVAGGTDPAATAAAPEGEYTGPIRFRLGIPNQIEIAELIKATTSEQEVIALQGAIKFMKGTEAEKQQLAMALETQAQKLAAVREGEEAWNPETSPAKLLREVTSAGIGVAAINSLNARSDVPPEQKQQLIATIQKTVDDFTKRDGTSTVFDPNKELSIITRDATTAAGASAAITAIKMDGRFDQATKDRATAELTALREGFIQADMAKAEQDGSPMEFVPFGADGLYQSGNAVTVMKRGGQWVNVTDGTPVDITKGKVLNPETVMDTVKQFNDEFDEVAIVVAQGANGVRDLLNYRELVINNPAAVNKYSNLLGTILGEGEAAAAALKAFVKADGSYDYGFEDRKLNSIQGLTAEAKAIAQAQLRAAYAIAKSQGSSGQGLSDTELGMALANIGQGVNDPSKVIGLINNEINSMIPAVETQRASRINSVGVMSDATVVDRIKLAPFGMPFEQFLMSQLTPEERVRLADAQKGQKTAGVVAPEATTDTAAGLEIPVSAPFTQEMAIEFPQFAQYVGRQVYAVPDGNGGYLIVPVGGK